MLCYHVETSFLPYWINVTAENVSFCHEIHSFNVQSNRCFVNIQRLQHFNSVSISILISMKHFKNGPVTLWLSIFPNFYREQTHYEVQKQTHYEPSIATRFIRINCLFTNLLCIKCGSKLIEIGFYLDVHLNNNETKLHALKNRNTKSKQWQKRQMTQKKINSIDWSYYSIDLMISER